MTMIAVGETFISVDKPSFKWPWQDQASAQNVRVLTIESIEPDVPESALSVAYRYTTPCGWRGTGAMTRDAARAPRSRFLKALLSNAASNGSSLTSTIITLAIAGLKVCDVGRPTGPSRMAVQLFPAP